MDTVSSAATRYTANKILELLLSAGPSQFEDFSRLICGSPDNKSVGAAIADFKKAHPAHNTFVAYHKNHDVQYFLRQTLSTFTVGDAKKIAKDLYVKKYFPSNPLSMDYMIRLVTVANRINDPMHRPLLNIAKVDALPFMMPEPKTHPLAIFMMVAMDKTGRGAAAILRAPGHIAAWSRPYREFRADPWNKPVK
jgi:hypothetical protein